MIESGGHDTDGEGTTEVIEEKDRDDQPPSSGSGNGLASGLQPGGTIPGGGPGAMIGSIGTGGGSNDNEATGDAGRNNIDDEER
jgi:hypothetical protein